MKKVLFLMRYPEDKPFSIKQKLDGQMKAVSNLGYDVYYISFDKHHYYLNHNSKKQIIYSKVLGNSYMYYHLFSYYDMFISAILLLKKLSFDYIYIRSCPINVIGYSFFRFAHNNSKIIVEIPTYPPNNERPKSLLRRIYLRFSNSWWKRCANYISLFTVIGEKAEFYLDVPAINIKNGVFVDDLPLRSKKYDSNNKKHILAVASMCQWHGYDRLINGIAQWKSDKANDYVIDLVGDEGDGSLQIWKELVNSHHLENQVVFHGTKKGKELDDLFDLATIGVSSLGLYRNGYYYGSVLKLREYLARGLPFVYAHEDPDIPQNMKWCLNIPNDETAVDMETLDEFIRRIEETDYSTDMRKYAKDNMSWESQFVKVFKRLEDDYK